MHDRHEYHLHTRRIDPVRQHYAKAHAQAQANAHAKAQANAQRKPRVPTWIKLAALVALIGLAGGVTEARAESWTGPDKRLHLAAGALVAAPVSMLTDSWRAGAAAGCAVGVAKEISDMRSPGRTPSYRDAVVTCVGAAVGAQLGVMVAPVKGGVWVGKSLSF